MRTFPYLLSIILTFSTASFAAEIHEATKQGDQARVESLLNKDPGLLNARDDRESTPLHFACDSGHTGLVALLLEQGAELHPLDVDGDTPLHWAAFAGHIGPAKLLLDRGADINAKNNNRNSPLHYAVLRRQIEMARLLADSGADLEAKEYEDHTPLHFAALMNERPMALLLIEKGADIEARNDHDRTPLLLVARETGSADMARALIEQGARIEAKDKYDDTSLGLAVWRGFKDLVDLLLDEGACISAAGDEGEQALISSAERKLDRLFALLVKKGANLDIRDRNMGSLLHAAAGGGSPEIARILIEQGKSVNEQDLYGWTPLHYAALRGRTAVAGLLLDQGADAGLRSKGGYTPLNIAEKWGHDELAKLLLDKGVEKTPVRFPKLEGTYFGQKPPGPEPELFALDVVTTNGFEHGCITFTPDGKEAYWSTGYMIRDTGYSDGAVFSSQQVSGQWIEPDFAFFGHGFESDDDVPFCSPDGKRLYFLSRRPIQEGGRKGKENVWYVEREGGAWSEPRVVDQNVNAKDVHWQISVSGKGTLYFHSGQDDAICYSPLVDGRHAPPKPVSNKVGDDFSGGTPFIAPDGSYLIFSSGRPGGFGRHDLYITFKNRKGDWCTPFNMGPTVNNAAGEICPIVSPDQKYLFFITERNGIDGIYWMEADIIEKLREKAL